MQDAIQLTAPHIFVHCRSDACLASGTQHSLFDIWYVPAQPPMPAVKHLQGCPLFARLLQDRGLGITCIITSLVAGRLGPVGGAMDPFGTLETLQDLE